MSYSIPYNKNIKIAYYDTGTYQFQLTEGGSPVSEDLTTQNIKFHLRSNGTFTPVVKDIVTEGWVVDNVNKIIKMELDTEALGMHPVDTIPGNYYGRIEWVDRKVILVAFTVEVQPQTLWSL